jgi:uncharacterized protein
MPLDAEALVAQLQLLRHPEGGWYREIFKSPFSVVRPDGQRRAGSSLIWFLLSTGMCSVWHRIAGSDEVWYFVNGGPLELTWIEPSGESHRVVLGPPGFGYANTAVVPADSWQTARPLDEPSLVQCGVAPGFDFADFSLLKDVPEVLAGLRQQHGTLLPPRSVG